MEASEGQRAAALPRAAKGISLQEAVCFPRSRGKAKGGGEGVGMGWEAGSRARQAELAVRREQGGSQLTLAPALLWSIPGCFLYKERREHPEAQGQDSGT